MARGRKAGTPDKLIHRIEDDTAAGLTAKDSVIFLYAKLRSMYRRGYLDDEEMRYIDVAFETALRFVELKLDYARYSRQHTHDAMNGLDLRYYVEHRHELEEEPE